ncbi:hypothetical protein HY486_03250 [Candidatus Woesearchaeota archaeon]|nr:hypothetical protein [Candidatus Woesearchaeota archaeon]
MRNRKGINASDPASIDKHGIGVDYGLIFPLHRNKICASIDGSEWFQLCSGESGSALFYHDSTNSLYYTLENMLFRWPHKELRCFDSPAEGITIFKGELTVCLPEEGKIMTISGKVLYDGLTRPRNARVLNNELYYTEGSRGGGLVKAPNQKIASAGAWTYGLDVLDGKLYFGGEDGKVYSFDGSNVMDEPVWRARSPIKYLHAVREKDNSVNLYACCIKDRKTVLSDEIVLAVNLTNGSEHTFLEERGLSSIVSAPVEFIRHFMEIMNRLDSKRNDPRHLLADASIYLGRSLKSLRKELGSSYNEYQSQTEWIKDSDAAHSVIQSAELADDFAEQENLAKDVNFLSAIISQKEAWEAED